ncbi:hypothetical protein QNO21_03200 [Microbacterium sp. zg-Y818]|uniref:hypothetical protein n=1 Tax=unclassified Microbacterium TaxID=2609290 RepID=UPI00214C3A7C|nr:MULTISPECIES: hypothetical protein [unclassified Microbacterium]MCR2801671.1 hypothetical protein [Microbacterium sp. zg.Y818]WIM23059.1 hypothetical protein QNO21_03200 [Microbacterium sp. zg-Y818]
MRWDRLFEDLEDQLASEWEAERAALDTEAERLRLSKLSLRERLRALVGTEPAVSVDLVDGTVATGTVSAVGADWFAMTTHTRRGGALLVPFAGTAAIGVPHADLLRSARPVTSAARLADRMTLGFVLRDLSRRRIPITAGLAGGRLLSGTIDRAGADHVDLALHDLDAPRRAAAVGGHRLVPTDAVLWVRLDSPAALA